MFIASSFNEIHALLAAVSEFLVRILFFIFQQTKGLLTLLTWNRKSSRINNEDFAIKELFTIIASLSWDIPTMQVYDPLLSLYSEIHIPVLYIGTVHADAMIKNYNTGGERKGETSRWHTRTS